MKSEGVDQLLSRLGQSGQTDSEGTFTISIERALEKLAHFQLVNLRDYVLNAVAAAVLGGATYAKFKVSMTQTELRFDGENFTAEHLRSLFAQVIQPTDTRLEEMGVAVSSAMALKPRSVRLESWDGEQGVCLSWSSGRWQLEPMDAGHSTEPVNRLEVVESVSVKRASDVRFGSYRERKVLEERARWAPLDLRLNELKISGPVSLSDKSSCCAGWLHQTEGKNPLEADPPEPALAPNCAVFQPYELSAPLEAVLALDHKEQAWKNGYCFLVNGIAFQAVQQPGNPFVSVVVRGDFRKNVSHTDLAHDQKFQATLDQLSVLSDCLVADRLMLNTLLPEPFRDEITFWAPELIRRLESRADLVRAQGVRRWLKERVFLDDLESTTAWQEVIAELTSLGSDAQIQEVDRLARSLALAAEESLESQNLVRCRFLCDRAYSLGQLTQPSWLDSVHSSLWLLAGLQGTLKINELKAAPAAIQATLYRLAGKLDMARPEARSREEGAFVLLGLKNFAEAREILESLPLDSPVVGEALRDCLRMTGGSSERRRILELHQKTTAQRGGELQNLGNFLLLDLCRTERSHGGFTSFLGRRLAALREGTGSGPLSVVNADFEQIESLLRKKNPYAQVMLQSTLVWAEKRLSPGSPYMSAIRSRSVHLLRLYGHWDAADQLLARGTALAQVALALKSIQQSEGGKPTR